MYKRPSLVICLVLLFCSISVFAADAYFTAEVNKDWEEPGNWSTGRVPDQNDRVIIPDYKTVQVKSVDIHVLSIENNGSIEASGSFAVLLETSAEFINKGDVRAENTTVLVSSKENYVTNTGKITGNKVYIRGYGVNNQAGGRIIGTNDEGHKSESNLANFSVSIEAGQVKNDGYIGTEGKEFSENSEPGGVIIEASNLENRGQIISADGKGPGNGGNIIINCWKGDVDNYGMIRLGSGGEQGNGGSGMINAHNVNCYSGSYLFGGMGALFGGRIQVNVTGKIQMKGEAASGTGLAGYGLKKAAAITSINDYTYFSIVGDTVDFGGETGNTYGEFVRVRANTVRFFDGILMADKGITIETMNGGTVDFSAFTGDYPCSTTNDSIRIFSDNVILPEGGLAAISQEPVAQYAENANLTEGHATFIGQTFSETNGDSVTFTLQNTGTKAEAFDYAVYSELGSVKPVSATTPVLAPLEIVVLEFPLIRPDGVTSDTTDYIKFTLSYESVVDTLTASVNLLVDNLPSSIKDSRLAPTNHRLIQSYPNPFNPRTSIQFNLPQAGQVIFSVFNERGEVVFDKDMGILLQGTHHTVWDGSAYSSGLYFFVIESNGVRMMSKGLLVK